MKKLIHRLTFFSLLLLVCCTKNELFQTAAGTGVITMAETPVFSPAAGTYSSGQNVTITSGTAGATIRYTTDGSTPSQTVGTVYTVPVSLSENTSLKAIAYLSGLQDSPVASGDYNIRAANPAFSPSPGIYSAAQNVTITCATAGAAIRYTTDGSTPSDTMGTVYSGAIPVSATTTVKAIAYKTGMTNSNVVTGIYTILAFALNNAYSITHDGTYVYVVTTGRQLLKLTPAGVLVAGPVLLPDALNTVNMIHYNPDDGYLYITVATINVITRKYDTSLNLVSSWSGMGAHNNPIGIRVYNSKIYIAHYGNSTVKQYNLDGSTTGCYSIALASPVGVATDGTYLYVTQYTGNIVKYNLSDGSPVGTIVTGLDYPMNLYYHGGYLYVAECNNGGVNGKVSKYSTTGVFQSSVGPYPDVNDVMVFNGYVWIVCGNNGGSAMANTVQIVPEF